MIVQNKHVCVVGLGYVGLPLLYHFAQGAVVKVSGYDNDYEKLAKLAAGWDHTASIPVHVLGRHDRINWTDTLPHGADYYVICVPTPDHNGVPNYEYVDSAIEAVLGVIETGGTIILESTVAPNTMRSRIVPKLTHFGHSEDSILLAHSPERVNPGPTAFGGMVRCTKVVGVDRPYTDPAVDALHQLYSAVFDAVLLVDDTRIAELAKCFENMQRDMNIALMNELSMICHRDGIDYASVIAALRTKPSSPVFMSGLVGGHCIPVDPYYLAAYYDDVWPNRTQAPIVGRRINEDFTSYVAMVAHTHHQPGNMIVVLGGTYKPDVPDFRNSGALKIAEFLRGMGHVVAVIDQFSDAGRSYDILPYTTTVDVVIGAVNHRNTPSPVCHSMKLAIDCKFVNVGQAFRTEQLSMFNPSNIINL